MDTCVLEAVNMLAAQRWYIFAATKATKSVEIQQLLAMQLYIGGSLQRLSACVSQSIIMWHFYLLVSMINL